MTFQVKPARWLSLPFKFATAPKSRHPVHFGTARNGGQPAGQTEQPHQQLSAEQRVDFMVTGCKTRTAGLNLQKQFATGIVFDIMSD